MRSLAEQILALLIAVTALMLLVRKFVPVFGPDLWRLYYRGFKWLLLAPFRLLRLLVNEIRR